MHAVVPYSVVVAGLGSTSHIKLGHDRFTFVLPPEFVVDVNMDLRVEMCSMLDVLDRTKNGPDDRTATLIQNMRIIEQCLSDLESRVPKVMLNSRAPSSMALPAHKVNPSCTLDEHELVALLSDTIQRSGWVQAPRFAPDLQQQIERLRDQLKLVRRSMKKKVSQSLIARRIGEYNVFVKEWKQGFYTPTPNASVKTMDPHFKDAWKEYIRTGTVSDIIYHCLNKSKNPLEGGKRPPEDSASDEPPYKRLREDLPPPEPSQPQEDPTPSDKAVKEDETTTKSRVSDDNDDIDFDE